MRTPKLLGLIFSATISIPVYSADFSVSVTNLTRGVYFTPLLISAHLPSMSLFEPGAAASEELQAMAEGGDIAGLSSTLAEADATVVENPAGGLLGPGQSTSADFNTDEMADNTALSLVAMMLPTNDGFVGLNGIVIPTEPGSYSYQLSGYDAGTEANDEVRGGGAPGTPGYPAPGPVDTSSGVGGTGIAATVEGFVHVHRNALGDVDPTGGISDIDSTVHRWLNPVARVTITVN
jgi:hypothetical protein